VPCGVLVRDAAGVVHHANAAAEQIIGLTLARMRGHRPEELWEAMREDGSPLPPAERPSIIALRTRRPVRQVTLGIRRPDGEWRWLQVDAVPICGPDGAPRHVVTSFVDVTARKQLEQQQAMLAQSDKLRALGQLAGGVAHNLNQALAIIAGYSDLAREGLAEPDLDRARLRDTLELVAQAAMDGGEMVARLIRFARSQRGQARELVRLDELLAEVAQLTAPRWRDAAQMEGRAIAVSVHTEGDVVLAGDPASLREAFINLVFNAVDALPAGGQVALTASRNGAEIGVRVTDSGVGMPPDVQTRIFEPFYTTKGERGSGLGLAMVLSIVEQHGGRVAVRSAPDQGTTIQVTLPAGLPAAPRPAPRPACTPRPLRVLAVDDDAVLAEMVRVMLAPLGARVATATSGQEALTWLEREPFDLVITDVGMPGMTGWELTAAVRARWPAVRRVLATGWGAAIDPAVARAQGIETVIAKPYRRAELVQLLAARPAPHRRAPARGKAAPAPRPAPAKSKLAARR
jgi:PAS domain S-box-containing protein